MKITNSGRELLLVCVIAGFLPAALKVAAPLHAHACMGQEASAFDVCHDASEQSDSPHHDADKCPICQYLFGLSGNTLPPAIPNEERTTETKTVKARCDSSPKTYALTLHIIPRPPPGLSH